VAEGWSGRAGLALVCSHQEADAEIEFVREPFRHSRGSGIQATLSFAVIPASAGIQRLVRQESLDFRFRGGDESGAARLLDPPFAGVTLPGMVARQRRLHPARGLRPAACGLHPAASGLRPLPPGPRPRRPATSVVQICVA